MTTAYAGVTFKCNALGFEDYIESNGAGLIGEHLLARCKSKHGLYDIDFVGIGPGLRISSSNMIISCPFVRKNKIEGTYIGVKASAVAGIGATVAVVSNKRLGVCSITGLEVGLGASVTIGRMTINEANYAGDYGFHELLGP